MFVRLDVGTLLLRVGGERRGGGRTWCSWLAGAPISCLYSNVTRGLSGTGWKMEMR